MEMPVINTEFLHINVYAHTVGTRPSFSTASRRRGKVVREQRVSHSCDTSPDDPQLQTSDSHSLC